jgi:hypothetical protein
MKVRKSIHRVVRSMNVDGHLVEDYQRKDGWTVKDDMRINGVSMKMMSVICRE